MKLKMRTLFIRLLLMAIGFTTTSCTVSPTGERAERAAATQAGVRYQHSSGDRALPTLSPDAPPDELVRYALLTNADLEARYWEWRSAIEQIPQEGTQKTNVSISLNSLITNGSSAARLTSLGVGNDAMNNLILPGKLKIAATIAMDNARAAGFRFDSARYKLRSSVLTAYLDYALTAELIRLEGENNQLLDFANQTIQLRLGTGSAMQQDLLKAANELETSQNASANLHAKAVGQVAALNVLLNRDPTTPIALPKEIPPFTADGDQNDQLLQIAVRNNPELHALAAEAAGRQDAVKLAKQDYLPEFGVNISTDLAGVTQSLLGSVMVPALRYQAIDASIRQAEDNLRAAAARQNQFHYELAARIVTDLATLRDAQRQIDLLEKVILPRARQMVSASQVSYRENQTALLDLLDSERTLIALRRLDAELKITRQKQQIDLDALRGAGIDRD
jgi:cobalt-zinc-cadmium efflux system outer membrane protein